MTSNKGFNLKTLQELTVERSKYWSNLFQKLSEQVETADIPINELGELYKDEVEEESNESEDMESEEEENIDMEVLQDFSKSIMTCRNKDETVREFLSRTMQSNSQSQAVQELVSVLDSTLPVIEEHRRNLEKPRVKKVLNSFNPKEIANKSDVLLLQSHSNRKLPQMFKNISPISKSQELESSTDDSLHSDDTARYIRSSRKSRSHLKSSAANTMLIKSYRLAKDKRNALHEKYSCSQQDLDDMEYNRQLRRQREHKHMFIDSINDMHLHKSKYVLGDSQRKKRLRRLRSLHRHSSSSSDYSTDEESPPRRHCATSIKKKYRSISPKNCYNSLCAHVEYRHRHAPRCRSYDMTPSHCGCCRGSFREYKREKECTCFSGDTLCENYIHVANTSNEDWIVENCTPTTKPIKKRLAYSDVIPRRSKELLKRKKRERLSDRMEVEKSSFNTTEKSSKALSFDVSGISPFSSTVLSQQSNKNFTTKAELSKIEEEVLSKSESDGEFLAKRIKLTPTKEIQTEENVPDNEFKPIEVQKKSVKKKEKSSTKKNVKKDSAKKTKETSAENETQDTTADEDFLKAIEESKKTYEQEKQALEKISNKEAQESPILKKSTNTENKERAKEAKKLKKSTDIENKDGAKEAKKLKKSLNAENKESAREAEKLKESINVENKESAQEEVKLKESTNDENKESANKTVKEQADKSVNSSKSNRTSLSKSVSSVAILNESSSSRKTIKNNVSRSSIDNCKNTQKILVYKPGVTTDLEVKNGRIKFTREYLAKILGDETARLFFKFYAGKKDFNAKLHVYFCPPATEQTSNDDSGSEDELFCFGKYGYLTEEK